MPSLTMLSTEVLDRVCQHLSQRELAAVSLLCSSLHQTAVRLLYRDVQVSSAVGNLSLVMTLARRPQLAQHARSFSITGATHAPPLRPFYELVARVLRTMPCLTSLDLALDHRASWVLAGCALPHLLRFRCTFVMDAHVTSFLRTAPLLHDLEVHPLAPDAFEKPGTLPEHALPRLASFTGSSTAALAIIPFRPVSSVHLASGDCTPDVVARLAGSCSPIQRFTAQTTSPPIALLPHFAQHMPQLLYLRLDTKDFVLDPGDVGLYEGIVHELPALRALRAFELSGIYWPSSQKETGAREWRSPLLTIPETESDSAEAEVQSELLWAYY
ncbi:hypothetical protein EV715DRAFT_246262 [Schizophyllum commune]